MELSNPLEYSGIRLVEKNDNGMVLDGSENDSFRKPSDSGIDLIEEGKKDSPLENIVQLMTLVTLALAGAVAGYQIYQSVVNYFSK